MVVIEKDPNSQDNRYHLKEGSETKETFGRIIAGLGFPTTRRPGFAMVLAEDYSADVTKFGSPRHLYALAEVESHDLEELYRGCLDFRQRLQIEQLCGNDDHGLENHWRNIARAEGGPYIRKPSGFDESFNLDFIAQLLLRHKTASTLHMEPCVRLRSHLSHDLNQEGSVKRIEELPAVFALGCALLEIETTKLIGHYERTNLRVRKRSWLA